MPQVAKVQIVNRRDRQRNVAAGGQLGNHRVRGPQAPIRGNVLPFELSRLLCRTYGFDVAFQKLAEGAVVANESPELDRPFGFERPLQGAGCVAEGSALGFVSFSADTGTISAVYFSEAGHRSIPNGAGVDKGGQSKRSDDNRSPATY